MKRVIACDFLLRLAPVAFGLLVGASGCEVDPRGVTPADSSAVLTEARAFMEGYARELKAGDGAAIAARYDTTGAYLLGNGTKEFLTHDSIIGLYRGASANTPSAFDWIDLSYEPIGADAVAVVGRFTTRHGAGPALTLSYSALLRRQAGQLRIRVEDESIDPRQIPPGPAAADSAR